MPQLDAIVVGAGMAGLTTARLLARHGQRVLVCEARDRLGGRVYTERSGGRVTDRGASWIHGIHEAPLYAVTEAFGMHAVEFTVGSYQPDGRPIAYYGPDAVRLSNADVAAFADDVRAVDKHLSRRIAAAPPGTSYGAVAETVLAGMGWDTTRRDRVREFLRHRAEEQYGVWIDDLDAHGLDDDETLGDEVVFPDGYDRLATHLADGLDVRLRHVVTSVRWNDGVTVTTHDAVFWAPVAVLTVPVGVLTAGTVHIDPPLPEPISGALASLEMNAFEKIFLRFDTRFWDEDVYAIRRQGDAGRWWHSFYDLTPLHGEPTLLTFAAGPCARAVRGWTDRQIAGSVLAALREIYDTAVNEPTEVTVTRWQDDEFARGSYAYLKVGGSPADHDLLATPVGGVLHLAGEATWTDDPATVTAALLSGQRAAQRVLGRPVPIDDLWG